MYTTSWCSFCSIAKRFLESKQLEFEEIDIEKNNISRAQLQQITGRSTVPQIVIDDNPIGGYEDLMTLYQTRKLIKETEK